MYKIVRYFYRDSSRRTIEAGLTLEEAQTHCGDPNASSRTAQSVVARRRTQLRGPWFDGYEET
jgi:hypothetical protein